MSLLRTLKRHLNRNTDLGLKLKALPSILSYPKEYQLGKKSFYIKCKYCGQRFTDINDVEYVMENGICLGCETIMDDARMEAKDQLQSMADTSGMSVEDYTEALGL